MGDLVGLAQRLRAAEQATKVEWRRLGDRSGGPFEAAQRVAGSGEAWRGAAAEHFCELLVGLGHQYLGPLVDELGRLGGRLEKVADEVEYVIRVEANGGCAPLGMDIDASLARLQRCEVLRSPPPGWCDGLARTGDSTYVSIDPGRTRDLAALVRRGGDELRSAFARLRGPLAELGLEPFPELRLVAAAAGELSDKVVKRVEAYEEADRRAGAGFTGGLGLDFVRQAVVGVAAPPEGAGPHRSKKQWRAQAMARAGIDPTKWNPKKGMAANKSVIPKVYDYYGSMYRSHPDQFWWMGMGALVGSQFYAAFTDLCIASHATGGDVHFPFADYVNPTGRDLRFFEKTLLKMQQKIFLDLSWQHEAFMAGGIEEIDRLAKTGAFGDKRQTRAMTDAWRDIASGDPSRVARGNEALIFREQHDVIQKDYNKIRRRDWPVGQAFTWFLSRNAGDPSPIPGNKPFRDTVPVNSVPDLNPDWVPERLIPGKDGDVSNFNDRWKWIDKDMLPAYERFIKEHPDEMDNTVGRPVEERAKRFQRLPGKCG